MLRPATLGTLRPREESIFSGARPFATLRVTRHNMKIDFRGGEVWLKDWDAEGGVPYYLVKPKT